MYRYIVMCYNIGQATFKRYALFNVFSDISIALFGDIFVVSRKIIIDKIRSGFL